MYSPNLPRPSCQAVHICTPLSRVTGYLIQEGRSEAALIAFQYKSLHVNSTMLVQNDPGIPYMKN
jgi:hypothetical protein